ncbi:STAS domain-containing protein [Streptomyces sp. NPDC054919]
MNRPSDPSSASREFLIKITHMPGDRVVVALTGPMDWATARAVRTAALEELASGARRLVLDLAEVHFLDSSGIGAIASAYRKAALVGASVALARLSPALERRYQISGLHLVVPLYPDLFTALAPEGSPGDLDISGYNT